MACGLRGSAPVGHRPFHAKWCHRPQAIAVTHASQSSWLLVHGSRGSGAVARYTTYFKIAFCVYSFIYSFNMLHLWHTGNTCKCYTLIAYTVRQLSGWLLAGPQMASQHRKVKMHGLQMIRAKYDSCKLTGRFAQDDSHNRGRFAQFYGFFVQASCYVVFLSN